MAVANHEKKLRVTQKPVTDLGTSRERAIGKLTLVEPKRNICMETVNQIREKDPQQARVLPSLVASLFLISCLISAEGCVKYCRCILALDEGIH